MSRVGTAVSGLVAGAIVVSLALGLAFAKAPSIDYAALAWADACRLSGYDCHKITPPQVRFTARVGTIHGALGVTYPVIPVVWLDDDIDPEHDLLSYAILVHEMTHYLQYQTLQVGYPVGSRFLSCEMEDEAFAVARKVLAEHGHPELEFDSERGFNDWAERYGC